MTKRTNNDLQNILHNSEDRATRTPRKTRGDLRCSGRVSSSCSTCGACHVTFVTNDLVNRYGTSVSQMITDMFHFPVIFFMTYHRACNQSNTTGATSGAGIAYSSGAPEFTSLVLCVMFCRSLFILLSFFLVATVLPVLRFTDSYYHVVSPNSSY